MSLSFQNLLYNTTMLAAPLVVTPPFLFFERGRQQLWDRFGFWNFSSPSSLWMHGASLGEMIGLSHIARELKAVLPEVPIVASATSPTGLSKAKEFAIATKLLPFDHRLYFERSSKAISPKAFIFGETEIWPNLLRWLASQNIPSFLVNGRISESTLMRYLSFKDLSKATMDSITHIFAGSLEDQERFIRLGAKRARTTVVSNTKYDTNFGQAIDPQEKQKLRSALFQHSYPLVVFSSLRPGEEEILFTAVAQLERKGAKLCYLIAPRHAEKFGYFETKLKQFEISFSKRSQGHAPSSERVLLLDTLGEMAGLLPAADLVFVGGTLVDFGGHNPLEAAAVGVATVVGPYHSTVKEVVSQLRKSSALYEVRELVEVERVLQLASLQDPEIREMGQKAFAAVEFFRGGSNLIVNHIISELKPH